MKTKRILFIILVILVLGSLIYSQKFSGVTPSSRRFASKYKISKVNPYERITGEKAIDLLKKGTGILYIGFPECKWCRAYVKNIEELTKKEKVEKIYYYNILRDRKANNATYKEIVKLLEKHLEYDDLGKEKRVYVPAFIGVYKGDIYYFDDESSLDLKGAKEPKEYWTKDRLDKLLERTKELFRNNNSKSCSSCNLK